MTVPMKWCALLAVLGLFAPSPAAAVWPVDGAPVCVAPGAKELQSVTADGPGAVLVGWMDLSQSPRRVRVQRLRVDGTLTPGWPADGVQPASGTADQSNVRVVPDGAGGCYAAWYDAGTLTVRAQHILPAGTIDPVWPGDGVVVTQGYDDRLTRQGTAVSLRGLEPDARGGCDIVGADNSYGCHDGFCLSGGPAYFRRVDPAGVPDVFVGLGYCSSGSPDVLAIADGGGGVMALAYSSCVGHTTYQHARVGGEVPVTLASVAAPRECEMVRAADGSLVVGYASIDPATYARFPTVFHWNPDGTPAAGAPAAGVRFATTPQWHVAVDPSGASVFLWTTSDLAGTIRGTGLGPDGAPSPGWDPAGNPLVGPAAVLDRFVATTDGMRGAMIVWSDRRGGATEADIFASRALANGIRPAGIPADGYALCTAPGLQAAPRVVTLAPGVAVAVWQDGRSGVGTDMYAQLLRTDVPVPVQSSLARSEATPERVTLEWRLSGSAPEVAIERTRDDDEWTERARVVPGSLGRVLFEDIDVRPGESLGYRIAFLSDGVLVRSGTVWVDVPAVALAVRALNSSSATRLEVEVTLASASPARLELVDVAGRRVRALDLAGLPAGTHRIGVSLAGVGPGMAWLRLRQDGVTRGARVAIVR